MSNKREKRILNEIKELHNEASILAESGIYFHYDESDINVIYAMLIGTENTPYEKGFYFFKFTYPPAYPMQPPLAKYCTQGMLINPLSNSPYSVRFNPNLYVCGKVCLSMLNTWSGPCWVPTNTISNVLVAIQALVLNDEPLINEPGFENSPKKELRKYNDIIEYANIKIAVCLMMNNTPPEFVFFKDVMCENFMKNIDFYKKFVSKKNSECISTFIESPIYGMKLMVDYSSLLQEIEYVENTVKINDISKISLEK